MALHVTSIFLDNYDGDIWHYSVSHHAESVTILTIINWPLEGLGAYQTRNYTKGKVHMTVSSVDKIVMLEHPNPHPTPCNHSTPNE